MGFTWKNDNGDIIETTYKLDDQGNIVFEPQQMVWERLPWVPLKYNEKEISLVDLFLDNEEEEKAEYYVDSNGGELISVADFKSGFGRIERDGNYDTVYVQKLEECDDEELKLIAAYMDIDTDLVEYGWQEYEEEVSEEQ